MKVGPCPARGPSEAPEEPSSPYLLMDYDRGLFGDFWVTYPKGGGIAMATPPTSVAIFFLLCPNVGVGKVGHWGPQQSPPGFQNLGSMTSQEPHFPDLTSQDPTLLHENQILGSPGL